MKKGKVAGSSSGGNNSNRFLPNSLRIISSCLKTVSANATTVASSVKSAGASVAATISAASDDHKEQVTWAGFDKLELSSSVCKHVLLLGYQNGFQVLDVDDASNFRELVSKRDEGSVAFLQMQPSPPVRFTKDEGFQKSFPILLVVGWDELNCSVNTKSWGHVSGLDSDKFSESQAGNSVSYPRAVRLYSLSSQCYVHVLRFRSAVCMVRCSPVVVAVGLATQIYCFDAVTMENKFSVLTYPVPQLGGQGRAGVNIGYGPMALGPRWLAYASNDPLLMKTGCLSSQTTSPGIASPSTSHVNGTGLVAHYAMESGKQLAAGIANLGGRGYKTLSKYCHELRSDGPNTAMYMNPGSRTSGETDNAGVVVVKDIISRAVICQFKAHSTPISALCFDPSGTLLVTASVHGNTINIFRIMPSSNDCGSDSQGLHGSSYVHLYKFHRGIRSAVILDICFSCYSQWVAVVSSKGTCHVFVLSPFGGAVGFQNLSSYSEEPPIAPVLTQPWWSTSSSTTTQESILPPPLVTLSVICRIKDSNSGLLNSVNSATASVSGKDSVPSGALAAVFHNSIPCGHQHTQAATLKPLEHLLVYTPSGHVVQYQIQPSFGENSDDDSRHPPVSFMQFQNVELSINAHPVQWWDVCRRSHWPEKEEIVSEILVTKQEAPAVSDYLISATNGIDLSKVYCSDERSNLLRLNLSTSKESSHLYLANAEVQYNRGRSTTLQNPKIKFFMAGPPPFDDTNGEYEVENLPISHVELRQKELLPVFDPFHRMRSALSDRHISPGRYSNALSLESSQAKDKASEETIICHSKPASFSSTEGSDGGSSRRTENLLDFDNLDSDQHYPPYYQNCNEHAHERTYTGFNTVVPKANFPAVVSDAEGALPSKISCQNHFLDLDLLYSDASQVDVDGNITLAAHKSFGTGILAEQALCKMQNPDAWQKELVVGSDIVASLDSGKEGLNPKKESFFRAMTDSVGIDGEEPKDVQEVINTANSCEASNNGSSINFNQEEQDISGSVSAFVETNGGKRPAEAQGVTDGANNCAPSSSGLKNVNLEQEEQDNLRFMSALDKVDGKKGATDGQEETDAANCAPSNNSITVNVNLNQEGIIEALRDFSSGSSKKLEPACGLKAPEAVSSGSCNKSCVDNWEEDSMSGVLSNFFQSDDELLDSTETKSIASVSDNIGCKKEDDNREEVIPCGMFDVFEKGQGEGRGLQERLNLFEDATETTEPTGFHEISNKAPE